MNCLCCNLFLQRWGAGEIGYSEIVDYSIDSLWVPTFPKELETGGSAETRSSDCVMFHMLLALWPKQSWDPTEEGSCPLVDQSGYNTHVILRGVELQVTDGGVPQFKTRLTLHFPYSQKC